MDKNDLLRHIAETAYNVGYGAKMHFATHDIVDKVPGMISFLSMAVGVFALYIDELSIKHLSATFIVLGIVGLYINFYDSKKECYMNAGTKLTQTFNELKALYFIVKSAPDGDLPKHQDKLTQLEEGFCNDCISKQIIFSGWYAHYKFFWQHQIEWIDEQKKFSFFRDKIPLSLSVTVFVVLAGGVIYGLSLLKMVCDYVYP